MKLKISLFVVVVVLGKKKNKLLCTEELVVFILGKFQKK